MALQKEQDIRKSDQKHNFKKMKEALARFKPKYFLYYDSELLLQADPEQISCFLKTIHHWRNERNEVSSSLQQFCRELRSLVCSYWNETFHINPQKQRQIKHAFQIFLADSQLYFFINYFDAEDLLFLFNQSGGELSQTESGHALTFTLAASRNHFPKFSTILKSIPLACFKITDKMGNTPFHYALEKLFEIDVESLVNNKVIPIDNSDTFWNTSLQAIRWMFQNNIDANSVNAIGESPFDILIKHYRKTIETFAKKHHQIIPPELEQLQPFAQLIVWFDQFLGLTQLEVKPENRLILDRIIDKRSKALKEALMNLLILDLSNMVEDFCGKSETKFTPLLKKFGAIRNDPPTPTNPTVDSHNIGVCLSIAES
jgi:hypothetical protein